jgi:CRISPR-associated protein Cmr2
MTPPRSLLALSFGPVQDFIAAARRTADLDAGSQLLLRVVGAAAKQIDAAQRIFPRNDDSGGANKILAVIEGDPAEVVRAVKQAAKTALMNEWESVLTRLDAAGQRHLIDEARAKKQLDGFLEIYAAWVPLPADGNEKAYANARQSVERLLAGRKALRDFGAATGDDEGLPKSPLDPSRATVIRLGRGSATPEQAQRAPLNLKPTEVLDAVSVLKRVGIEQEQVKPEQPQPRKTPVKSTRELAQLSVSKVTPEQQRKDADDDDWTPDFPYYAVLVADGDRMGRLLSKNESVEAHREISGQLDEFAKEADKLVKKHDGQLVYAGGDDVFALLPVGKVLACAEQLALAFAKEVAGATLSVGVAIVHYLEPLSGSLKRGRDAEKAAKKTRNALAVALHTRGGAPLTVSQSWTTFDKSADPEQQRWKMTDWVKEAAEGRITRGVPYELRELARQWPSDATSEDEMKALNNEVKRVLRRKQEKVSTQAESSARTLSPTTASGLEAKLPNFSSPGKLAEFADLLVLARFLSGETLRTAQYSVLEVFTLRILKD